MVTGIVNSIRMHMCKVICDDTVRMMEDVVFKYGDNHQKIKNQLEEKMFRVEAANKKSKAQELIDPYGTRFLTIGFLTLEEDEDPPFMTVEERREHYWCGNYYVGAKDLPTWNVIRHTKDPLVLDSWDSITMETKISFWEGDGRCLEVDVLACISEELLVQAPLSMNIGSETCQSTQAQVPGGGVLNGFRLSKISPAKQAITTEDVEDPMACLKMILESTVGNNHRTLALPCICTAYCTREK